jgi:hypothetical protein
MPTDNTYITVRIIGIELDYDDLENAEIIFSNSTRLDDSVYILGEIQAQASRAYGNIQLNKYANKQAASNTALFSNFVQNTLNATFNKMVSDGKSQVETSEFGIKIRQWDDTTNNFGEHGMWINPYRMIFSDDSFRSSNTAFGLLNLPDGTERMGISTDVIFGNFVLTQNLTVSNTDRSVVINKDGIVSTATVGTNTYSVGINPSTIDEIFNIKLNGEKQLYVDMTNTRLVYNGYINATGGTLGNLTVTGTLSGGYIYGSNISGSLITSTGILDGNSYSTVINNGFIQTSLIQCDLMYSGITTINSSGINVGNGVLLRDNNITCGGTVSTTNLSVSNINSIPTSDFATTTWVLNNFQTSGNYVSQSIFDALEARVSDLENA